MCTVVAPGLSAFRGASLARAVVERTLGVAA
jgi:hypothetical protein